MVLFLIGGALAVLVVFFIVGATRPLPPYPAVAGAEVVDSCPGPRPLAVPWAGTHPDIRNAHTAARGFQRLVDAGMLDLIEGAAACFEGYSRPVATALIMECAAPMVSPDTTDNFRTWYTSMALVYHIDDRIIDPNMLLLYRKTLPTLTFKDKQLAAVVDLL